MSKLGTVLKTSGIILSVIGGAATVADVVVEKVVQPTQTQIVEELNYENQHIINLTDTYIINGVEVSYDEWLSTKQTFEILEEGTFVFYYGATDTKITASTIATLDLDDLTRVELENVPKTYTQNIKSGNTETEDGQYPVIVIPAEYVMSGTIAGYEMFKLVYDDGTYKVYAFSGTTPTYDEDFGGCDYVLTFHK